MADVLAHYFDALKEQRDERRTAQTNVRRRLERTFRRVAVRDLTPAYIGDFIERWLQAVQVATTKLDLTYPRAELKYAKAIAHFANRLRAELIDTAPDVPSFPAPHNPPARWLPEDEAAQLIVAIDHLTDPRADPGTPGSI